MLRNLAASGLDIGGISYSSAFLTGGIFGYDGVHPTPLGYAYVANLFIDAINATYGGDIPEVNLYPFVFGPLPSATAAISSDKAAPAGDLTRHRLHRRRPGAACCCPSAFPSGSSTAPSRRASPATPAGTRLGASTCRRAGAIPPFFWLPANVSRNPAREHL